MKDYKNYQVHMNQKRFNKVIDIITGVITVLLGLIVTTWWLILLTNA